MTEDYANRRLSELRAAAPVKCKKTEPFAIVSLQQTAKAFAAVHCPKAMVWLWLIHQVRKTGNYTVAVPNGALARYGITRRVKNLALRQWEKAGLITVERRSRKTPVVTLLHQ
jgi:hypothetical protein